MPDENGCFLEHFLGRIVVQSLVWTDAIRNMRPPNEVWMDYCGYVRFLGAIASKLPISTTGWFG